MQFAGEFETHLTVDVPDPAALADLRAWADQHHLKYTHIVLARGQHASQPMLTRHGHGTLSSEQTAAGALRRDLSSAGFTVTRVKIEAAPWNQDVPQTDNEAALHPRDRHFEHHVKLLLDDRDSTAVAEIAMAHGGHVSRNALRLRPDRRHERFVTQRCYTVGRTTARNRLDALRAALAAAGYTILDVEAEFVVHDSNAAIDAGWLEPEVPTR